MINMKSVGYIVTLEKSIREDDAEDIKTAISVKPIVEDINLHIAKTMARYELEKKLYLKIRKICFAYRRYRNIKRIRN